MRKAGGDYRLFQTHLEQFTCFQTSLLAAVGPKMYAKLQLRFSHHWPLKQMLVSADLVTIGERKLEVIEQVI